MGSFTFQTRNTDTTFKIPSIPSHPQAAAFSVKMGVQHTLDMEDVRSCFSLGLMCGVMVGGGFMYVKSNNS